MRRYEKNPNAVTLHIFISVYICAHTLEVNYQIVSGPIGICWWIEQEQILTNLSKANRKNIEMFQNP